MHRKVISLAKSTNVVTLPNRWCEENSIGKGDQVSVAENGDSVVISPVALKKTIVLDISGVLPMIRRILGAAYKSGYDVMKISYSTKEELSTAEEVIDQEFVGFEISEIDRDAKVIKAMSISEPSPDDFETMLRRLILMVCDMAEEIRISADDSTKLAKAAEKDKEVNKIADYCRRVINRNSLLKLSERYVRNPPLYFIVEQIEKVGDGFRDVALSDGIDEDMFKDAEDFFRMFYDLFYNFNFILLSRFAERRKELKETLEKKAKDGKSTSQYRDIIEKTFDMNGALIALNI